MSGAPVSSIRNLGPAMEAAFAKVGIADADTLREMGTDTAYLKLLKNGQRPHFIGYYVIEMGLQGRPWNDCQGDEKAALRKRFDALVAEAKGARDTHDEAFEAMMDAIGVIERE